MNDSELSAQLELLNTVHDDDIGEGVGKWDHEPLAQVQIKQFQGHKDVVNSCQFCGFEEEKLLTCSGDGTVKLWHFDEGKCLHTYRDGHTMNVSKARSSPDTQLIVSSGWDKKVIMWNVETGKILWTGYHDGLVTCCNFSHDGRHVISGSDLDHSLKVWDTYTGELITSTEDLHSNTITSCMFNPSDDRIVTTSMDMTTKFFDLNTRCNTITLKDHRNVVSHAAFTIDERKLATCSWDKGIFFYDISTGTYRSEGPEKLQKAHEGCISSCEFSEDGLVLVTGGYDSALGIWDMQHMLLKIKLKAHKDWIEDVSITKNGQWVMTASKDKTVRVWNLENVDSIPKVVEKRKAIGLRLYKCHKCAKPFSALEDDIEQNNQLCVFCRLQKVEERERKSSRNS